VVLNYVRSIALVKDRGKVTGAVVRDLESGSEFTVHAATVINATGIFVDELRKQDDEGSQKLLSVSRGTHIVVRPEVLGWKYAIMVPKTDDGRIIFAIPWLGKVIIGTTDLKRNMSIRSRDTMPQRLPSLSRRLIHFSRSRLLKKISFRSFLACDR
jgi:glycerol-3-phosphate dehydrogenase